MGVSLKRRDGTGLGVARGLEKADVAKGVGVWLSEVELLRLVLRFSRGVAEGRRADEAVEEAEEGGRGEEQGIFSTIVVEVVLEQVEPGLLGAGFRFGLVSEPEEVGDETPALSPAKDRLSSPVFSRSSAPTAAVGLLAAQGWLTTDVEQSGSGESDD